MKYEGYKIGPVIRDIRKDQRTSQLKKVAAKTGISDFDAWTGGARRKKLEHEKPVYAYGSL